MQQSATSAAAQKRLAREYELVYILTPNVDPDEADRIATRIQDVVARLSGKITKVDSWGRRRLAYPIKKSSRGVFIYVRMVGYNDLVAEIERNLRNIDSVVRFQTVRREGVFDLGEVTVDPEEAKFTRIEAPPAEEEQEPSFEERLGLMHRPREREEEAFEDTLDEGDIVPGAKAAAPAAAPAPAAEPAAEPAAAPADTDTDTDKK